MIIIKSVSDELISFYGIADMFPQCSKAFKQVQFQEIVEIPSQKPGAEQIASVSVNVKITRAQVITTAKGQSCEGQILTGKKLVIEGKINQKVEYIADCPEQPIHAAHFSIPFSTFIVLGDKFNPDWEFEVTGYVEDIYIKLLDSRKIFKNILFVLNAVPNTIS